MKMNLLRASHTIDDVPMVVLPKPPKQAFVDDDDEPIRIEKPNVIAKMLRPSVADTEME